jgi:hypothetical protein
MCSLGPSDYEDGMKFMIGCPRKLNRYSGTPRAVPSDFTHMGEIFNQVICYPSCWPARKAAQHMGFGLSNCLDDDQHAWEASW